MKNGESLKTGIAKLILILVCMVLTVTTITVGVFAASGNKKTFSTTGMVSFSTKNIEGEVVGKVTGYGFISGNNKYNGMFSASNKSTTTDEQGNEIGNALKPWDMGDIYFATNQGEVVDIEITITIKNRGDRAIVLNYLAPSSIDNIDITYKQAVTDVYAVSDGDWLDVAQASEVGKLINTDDLGNRTEENIVLEKEKFYTFKMVISIKNRIKPLNEEGVDLSFKFEMTSYQG